MLLISNGRVLPLLFFILHFLCIQGCEVDEHKINIVLKLKRVLTRGVLTSC